MKRKLKKWIALAGLVGLCLLAVAGLVQAGGGGQPVAPGFRPGTTFENPQEIGTSKENNPSGSAVMDGEGVGAGETQSGGGVWGWLADHGKGLLYGIAEGAVVAAGIFLGLGYGAGKVRAALGWGGGSSAGGSGVLAEGVANATERGAAEAEVAVTSESAVLERLSTAEGTIAEASKGELVPGTPLHKQVRWQEYQAVGGSWSYERWSKQYDVNMRNATQGLAREAEYRATFGGESKMLPVPAPDGTPGWRQIDIFRQSEAYAGQLKTGYQYLTQENVEAIRRDAYLVTRGLSVEWILEKGGSKPLLQALEGAGVDVHIGPKIP